MKSIYITSIDHLDNILDMQDPKLFIDIARVEIRARSATGGVQVKDRTWVAETIAAMYVAFRYPLPTCS